MRSQYTKVADDHTASDGVNDPLVTVVSRVQLHQQEVRRRQRTRNRYNEALPESESLLSTLSGHDGTECLRWVVFG